MAAGVLVVVTTAGDPGKARADAVNQKFVDITTVQPNFNEPQPQANASTGTFTVDCGNNEEEHFNPDNFIAQPGVRNGAQHLHDYVGNLTTNADSNNASLAAGDTTCKNGDQSTYFWPVVRINQEEDGAGAGGGQQQGQDQQGQNQQGQGQQGQGQQGQGQQGQGQQGQGQQGQGQQGQGQQGQGQQGQGQQGQGQQGQQGQAGRNQQNGAGQQDGAAQQDGAGQQNGQQRAKSSKEQQLDVQRNRDRAMKRQNPTNRNNGSQFSDGDRSNGQDENGNQNGNADLPGQDENNNVAENEGEILRPDVDLTFRGSPVGDVTAMPRFLRVLVGDAKVSTNGNKNKMDAWTCEGMEDQVRLDTYVICPEGSRVTRVHDFPSCWDGQNIDSEDHRSHVAFPNENGECENGFQAIPQLRITLKYDIPREIQEAQQYAVDSFPEEDHNPASDHDDFANVMSDQIMNRLVNCINSGQRCSE